MNISDLTLSQIRVLIAVVEAESFTCAAEALDLTQSAVSYSIKGIESSLGVKLLNRNKTGVTLTNIGWQVFLKCQEILRCTEEIAELVTSSSGRKNSRVVIGAFPSMSNYIFTDFLEYFRRKLPKIETILLEGSDEEVRKWISSRAVDLGTIILPEKVLDSVSILKDEFVCIVSNSHQLADCKAIDISQLIPEKFIMSGAGCKPYILEMFKDEGALPQVTLEAADVRTLVKMVQKNMGITIVPETLLSKDVENLTTLKLNSSRFREVGLASASFNKVGESTNIFVNELHDWVSENNLRTGIVQKRPI